MRAIRLTVGYGGEFAPRKLLILENTSGGIDILREGEPRVDGDRSVFLRIDHGDVILAVEWAEL